jgi:hypothetical protein
MAVKRRLRINHESQSQLPDSKCFPLSGATEGVGGTKNASGGGGGGDARA